MPSKKHARSPSADDHGGYIDEAAALKHPSPKRAKEIDEQSPYKVLLEHLEKSKSDDKPRNVLHWFRSKDLRLQDNKSLHTASEKAKEGNGHLITMYLYSPKDLEWHGTSPARTDFILQGLKLLQDGLAKKHIPFAIITADERAEKKGKLFDFVQKHDISHVYANFEYEIDEIRRDIGVVKQFKEDHTGFELLHDQTIIPPLELSTGSGGPHKVFTPYHKAWVSRVSSDPSLIDPIAEPDSNNKSATKDLSSLFKSSIPTLPKSKDFASKDDQTRIRGLWPAGNEAGMTRLREFLSSKVSNYANHRSEPARDPGSRMSAYFAAGMVGIRETLTEAKKANKGSLSFDTSHERGVYSWVREIVFREFYRHIAAVIAHTSLNLSQNLKFDFVKWETDDEGWKKWCEGKTGVPFIDAGMRQLNHEAYMHNRLRMNTSSYLSANLLLDYRRGERYFAEHLIDWDLCNNTQGWEPSYTVFNPVIQAEKCDPDGDYIRKWVPELKNVKGKAVFSPHNRLSKDEFEKLGYPYPHVDYSETARRAKERYKRDMAEADI